MFLCLMTDLKFTFLCLLVRMQRMYTIPRMIRTNLRRCFRNYVNSSDRKKICVVGSGPAGFYTAQHLLKNNITEVDIYEKLPVPFGLIRYGVAPDHPEIKAVINSFTKIALDPRCNFFGNVNVGQDIKVSELLNVYNAVVLACGASNDKMLGIPGESSKNVLSARHFVGWYNGHPDHVNEEINLNTEVVTVIGHGNVALDVARILLRNLEDLKTTDITEYAFEALKKSHVRKVILAGRRGPLQVSFTIKELREMIKLPGCNVVMNPLDFHGVPELLSSLPRPRKRLLELLCDTALKNESCKEASKAWELQFFRRPKAIICDAHKRVEKIVFGVNKIKGNLEDAQIINTDEEEEVECGLVLRSVGYQSIPIDEYVPFDKTKHIIPNVEGRVKDRAGLYCSGWVKTGPTGVILSTMYGSYETAEKLLEDIEKGEVPSAVSGTKENILELLRSRGVKHTTFDSWLSIDKVEQERGKAKDKPREKIYHVREMLQVV